MKGARTLSSIELQAISEKLSLRDRTLFTLGLRTGFRISELLSLDVSDVLNESGDIRESICVKKKNTKGKAESRTMPMHIDVEVLLGEHLLINKTDKNSPLFLSSTGKRMDRTAYHRSLKRAAAKAGVRLDAGIVASHSLRKTFAKKFYEASGFDLMQLKEALGHSRIETTTKYLQVDRDKVWKTIKNLK